MRVPSIFYPVASGLLVLLALFVGAASGTIAAGIAIAAGICVATMNHRIWRNYSQLKRDDFSDMYASAKGIDNTYLLYAILCITLPLSTISYYLLTSDHAAERNFGFVSGNPLGSLSPLYSHMQSIADDRMKYIFAKSLLPFVVAATYTIVALGGALMCVPAIAISWARRTRRQSRYLTGLTAVLGISVAAMATNISFAKMSSGCIAETEPGNFSQQVYPYIECVISISAIPLSILFFSMTVGCVISILKGILYD